MAGAQHALLTPNMIAGLAVLVSGGAGCASTNTPISQQFERERTQLSLELPLNGSQAEQKFTLGQYTISDLRPKRAPERSGQTYSFSLGSPASSSGEQPVLVWTVTGVGGIGIRDYRASITELVEMRRPGSKDSSWVLELFSGNEFQLMGALRGKGETFEIDSVPWGRLLLGENYGTRLVCFMKNGEIVAAVDIADDQAKVYMRPSLDEEERSVFAGAAAAIALRRYVIGATGSALRFVVTDSSWLSQIDCGMSFDCQIAQQDLVSILNDPKRRGRPTPGR